MGLTEDEYESFESDWQSQLQIRKELKDKPDELSDTKINYIKPLLTTIKLSVFARGNKDKSTKFRNLSERCSYA